MQAFILNSEILFSVSGFVHETNWQLATGLGNKGCLFGINAVIRMCLGILISFEIKNTTYVFFEPNKLNRALVIVRIDFKFYFFFLYPILSLVSSRVIVLHHQWTANFYMDSQGREKS